MPIYADGTNSSNNLTVGVPSALYASANPPANFISAAMPAMSVRILSEATIVIHTTSHQRFLNEHERSAMRKAFWKSVKIIDDNEG